MVDYRANELMRDASRKSSVRVFSRSRRSSGHRDHRDGDQPFGDHVPAVSVGRAGRDMGHAGHHHQAGLDSSIARLALAQRIALARSPSS